MSESGRPLYWDIFVMNAEGSERTQLVTGVPWDTPVIWSPDGMRIAFVSQRDKNREIYVMDSDGSNQANLTNNPRGDSTPAWSPDGTRIAFWSDRLGSKGAIYIMNADGSSQTLLTKDLNTLWWSFAWFPDGTKIAFHRGHNRFLNADLHTKIHIMNSDVIE